MVCCYESKISVDFLPFIYVVSSKLVMKGNMTKLILHRNNGYLHQASPIFIFSLARYPFLPASILRSVIVLVPVVSYRTLAYSAGLSFSNHDPRPHNVSWAFFRHPVLLKLEVLPTGNFWRSEATTLQVSSPQHGLKIVLPWLEQSRRNVSWRK